MGESIIARCHRCKRLDTVRLRRQIKADGDYQLAWWCEDCAAWAEVPTHWLPHAPIKAKLATQGATFEDIPVVRDYSDSQPCALCGAPGQWHHWAPQAYAGAFGKLYPRWSVFGTALCPAHHREWHEIVTPELATWKRGAGARRESVV